MVRRKKTQPPMKSHTIRMTDAEWAEMQHCAEIADESDSEYIRKAIEMRNKIIAGPGYADPKITQSLKVMADECNSRIETHKSVNEGIKQMVKPLFKGK